MFIIYAVFSVDNLESYKRGAGTVYQEQLKAYIKKYIY